METYYRCDVCLREFNSDIKLEKHLVLHVKSFQCRICEERFCSHHMLKRHLNVHHAGEKLTYTCPHCERVCATHTSLVSHIKSHDDTTYSCVTCGNTYKTHHRMLRHAKIHKDTGEEFACETCGKKFKLLHCMQLHARMHNQPDGEVPCKTCGQTFKSVNSMNIHARIHKQSPLPPGALPSPTSSHEAALGLPAATHECPKCFKRFASKSQLRIHMFCHEKSGYFPCFICGKVFPNSEYLKRHGLFHQAKKFKCCKCNSSYYLKHQLRRHEEKCYAPPTSVPTKPITSSPCPVCGKVYQSLNRHMAKIHPQYTGDTNYQCAECGKSFSNSANLKNHSFVHAQSKNYLCSICGKKLKTPITLRCHIAKKHGVKVKVSVKVEHARQQEKLIETLVDTSTNYSTASGVMGDNYASVNEYDYGNDNDDGDDHELNSSFGTLSTQPVDSKAVTPLYSVTEETVREVDSDVHDDVNISNKYVINIPIALDEEVASPQQRADVKLEPSYNDDNAIETTSNHSADNIHDGNEDTTSDGDDYYGDFHISDVANDGKDANFTCDTDENISTLTVGGLKEEPSLFSAAANEMLLDFDVDNTLKFLNSLPVQMFECGECDKSFSTNGLLRWHVLNRHEGWNYKCGLCKKKYKSFIGLECHLCKHIVPAPGEVFNPTCPHQQCYKTFKNIKALKAHYDRHSQARDHVCPILHCSLSFKTRPHLRSHITSKHCGYRYKFSCDVCGKLYKSKGSLNQHIFTHDEVGRFVCTVCGNRFKNKENLRKHMPVHLARQFNASTGETSTPVRAEFVIEQGNGCEVTKSLLIQPNQLKKRKRIRRDADQYTICPICGKSIKGVYHLKWHMMTHDEVKPFPCTYCDATFISNSKMKQHVEIHHMKIRQACDMCEQTFSQKATLKRHRGLVHTGEFTFQLCPLCGKKLNSKSRMQEHLSSHSQTRSFECDVCGRRFKQKRYLKTHLKKHMDNTGSLNVINVD